MVVLNMSISMIIFAYFLARFEIYRIYDQFFIFYTNTYLFMNLYLLDWYDILMVYIIETTLSCCSSYTRFKLKASILLKYGP